MTPQQSQAAFVPFGAAHLTACAAIAAAAIALVAAARRHPTPGHQRLLRLGLAVLLALAIAGALAAAALERELTVWDAVPLQLCDLLLLISILALVTRHRLACELLYYWAGAGTLMAILTPDLDTGFPEPAFFVFFGLHGLVIAAAALLTLGLGLHPRPGSVLRTFALTNAYAAIVFAVNLAFGTNFLYLRAKPSAPTVLDLFGQWPNYLLAGEMLALAIFVCLGLPFRGIRGLRSTARLG
jgi:hypothetical integral membrane protein (TIGR02206 family)